MSKARPHPWPTANYKTRAPQHEALGQLQSWPLIPILRPADADLTMAYSRTNKRVLIIDDISLSFFYCELRLGNAIQEITMVLREFKVILRIPID